MHRGVSFCDDLPLLQLKASAGIAACLYIGLLICGQAGIIYMGSPYPIEATSSIHYGGMARQEVYLHVLLQEADCAM